jgi:hypothetical protein
MHRGSQVGKKGEEKVKEQREADFERAWIDRTKLHSVTWLA